MPCDSVARKSALIPMFSNPLTRMHSALVGAKRFECGSLLPLCLYVQTTCLEPYRHDTANNVSVPILAPLDRAADPNGFSRAGADAVGVGRREAFGVRQLAAALSLCANNVPGTISA
ncbi:MAG: hypothetical protein GX456_01210 [Verrucomicrobia bacterium]|nr:hypothetical protein [Verrucomicrobiota bacterium]